MAISPTSGSTGTAKRQVRDVRWWMYPALFPVVCLLRVWLMTLRIRLAPDKHGAFRAAGAGRLVIFWHNRLLLSNELRRRFNGVVPMNGLVSASKDGAWLSAFFRLLGVGAIRGSSSWRGGQAMLEIARRLRAEEDVGVTPDGPRGPCYDWKSGVARLAVELERPIVLAGLRFHRAHRLASWDGFYLPMPFSRVDLDLDVIPLDDPDRSLPDAEFSERLRLRLMAITDDSGFTWTPKKKSREPSRLPNNTGVTK